MTTTTTTIANPAALDLDRRRDLHRYEADLPHRNHRPPRATEPTQRLVRVGTAGPDPALALVAGVPCKRHGKLAGEGCWTLDTGRGSRVAYCGKRIRRAGMTGAVTAYSLGRAGLRAATSITSTPDAPRAVR